MRAKPCKRSCFESDIRRRKLTAIARTGNEASAASEGAWTLEEKYATCKQFFPRVLGGERCGGMETAMISDRHTCVRDPLNNRAIWAREKDGTFVSEDTWINNEHQEFFETVLRLRGRWQSLGLHATWQKEPGHDYDVYITQRS